MFTGLVEETGEFIALSHSPDGARLTLRAPLVAEDVQIGDSVAVNGCCLTVTEAQEGRLAFDLLSETLRRTNLGALAPGAPVNLERALSAHARLGGHFVQGHVDASCPIVSFEKVGADHRLEITLPQEFARYVAFKGSIAIDGISLTVAEVHDASFVIWIIPHTLTVTNLRAAKAGNRVNLEFDLLAKYVERLLATR
jgi:riboflavin synthase